MKEELEALDSLGISLPSPAYLLGLLVFGLAGIAFWLYGKKHGRTRMKWIGVALMLYPYVIWQTVWLWAIGLALSVWAWLDRG